MLNIKKIFFLIFSAFIFLFSYSMLLHFRFIQSDRDKNFDKILYSSLVENKPVMVSDINRNEWEEVCILYAYQRPENSKIGERYSHQLSDRFYLSREWDHLPFFVKFRQPVWWMFFVDSGGNIVDLYRMSGRSGPAFYLGDNTDKDYYSKYFNLLNKDGFKMNYPENCQKRNNAFFMQNEILYNSAKSFLFVSKIK